MNKIRRFLSLKQKKFITIYFKVVINNCKPFNINNKEVLIFIFTIFFCN